MRRSLQNALGNGGLSNDMPLSKRHCVHYEKNEVSNSSFLNDEKYCDITFCIQIHDHEQGQNRESQEQDVDVKTNGILLVCLLLKLFYFF